MREELSKTLADLDSIEIIRTSAC